MRFRRTEDIIIIMMVVITIALIFVFFGMVNAEGASKKTYGNFHDIQYIKNYDGDTITVNLFGVHPLIGKEISVRLFGIDTPEIKGKCYKEKRLAVEAKVFVEQRLKKAHVINLLNAKRGLYFRIVGIIMADGININTLLVKKGLAVLYYGGKKIKNWCD